MAGEPLNNLIRDLIRDGQSSGHILIRDGQSSGHIPDWVGRERPPAGSRESMREDFQGTQDIAGAAERLCDEGSIVYDQSTPADISGAVEDAAQAAGLDPRDQAVNRAKRDAQGDWGSSYVGLAVGDGLLQATRGNCYEFVHLAAWIARAEGGLMHFGNSLRGGIDPETMEEWDGSSDIPRGKVIVSCSWFGGQTSDNTYHFAVSLGDGEVANNRGQGVQRERLYDVFGGWSLYSLPGGGIYFGDYACYAEKEPFYEDEAGVVEPGDEPATPPTTPKGPPRSAREQRRIGGAGGGVVLASVAALFTFLFGLGVLGFGDGNGSGDRVIPPPTDEAPAAAATLTPAPLAFQWKIACDPNPLRVAHGETGVVSLTGPFESPGLLEDIGLEWEVSDLTVVEESGGIILDLGDDFTTVSIEPGVGVRQGLRKDANTFELSTRRDGPPREESVTLTLRLLTRGEVDTLECQVVVIHEQVATRALTPTPSAVTPATTATPTPSAVTPAVTATPTPSTGTPAVTATPTPSTGTPAVTATPTPSTGTPAVTATRTPSPVTPAVTATPTPSAGTPATTPATVQVNGFTVTYSGPGEADSGGTLITMFRVEGPSVGGSTFFATLGDPPSDPMATHGSGQLAADGTITIPLDVAWPPGATMLYFSYADAVRPIAEILIR